jgi:serine protease
VNDATPDERFGGEWRRSERPRWAVLDPAGEPRELPPPDEVPGEGDESGIDRRSLPVYATVYVPDELIYDRGRAAMTRSDLDTVAARAGWTLSEAEEEGYFDGDTVRSRSRGESMSQRLRVSVASSEVTGVTAETPDAWEILRQLRADRMDAGVSLNHVLSTDSLEVNPFKANPFKANPFKANPFKANPFKANAAGVGIDSYASPGFGGRQPVTYLGAAPARAASASRPVVAVFDTGIGRHPWFEGDVIVDPRLPRNGEPIGITRASTDPELHPSLALPLDGIFDDAAGHGTFIAGVVLQQCGDAQILPVRVSDGEGVIVEFELLGALARLLEYIESGMRVDVLNLSFSYYHETPDNLSTVSEMTDLLARIRDKGVVVVCSAGNEATDRPTFPAALAAEPDRHVSVGALNPADNSVALFSNIGDWVDVYAPGVAVVSTVPVDFDGGIQAGTRDDKYGRRRETLDVDDFRGGFGVWSGTSFAAPVVSGRIAARILAGQTAAQATQTVLGRLRKRDHSRYP